MARHNPLTGYDTTLHDNFDYSETSAASFQDESGDRDTEPSYSCDAELDDEIIGKALSSPLFIHEREEPANLRQAYHVKRTSPNTENHDKNGHAKVYDNNKNFIMTNVNNSDTK